MIEGYEKKDIIKSPKTKVAPKKGELYKDGELWKFMWVAGKVRSYTTKEEAEIRLEKFIEQAKSKT